MSVMTRQTSTQAIVDAIYRGFINIFRKVTGFYRQSTPFFNRTSLISKTFVCNLCNLPDTLKN